MERKVDNEESLVTVIAQKLDFFEIFFEIYVLGVYWSCGQDKCYSFFDILRLFFNHHVIKLITLYMKISLSFLSTISAIVNTITYLFKLNCKCGYTLHFSLAFFLIWFTYFVGYVWLKYPTKIVKFTNTVSYKCHKLSIEWSN